MHAVAAFFASIITFVSGLFAPPIASHPPANIPATQPAAAAAAQTEIAGNPFTDPAAASAVAAIIPANAPAPAFSPPPAQTIINQPVIERIIERIVPQGDSRISADTLAAILADFGQSIENRIAAINPPKADIPPQVAASGNAGSAGFFPASQRIDQLSNTVINTPTITGGAISGASTVGAGSGSFDTLSAGTLALSGALTGADASFSGTLSAGTLNVAGLSSQGALIGPYFTATSTTATSTFAGGLTAANGGFNILQNGYVGIGTTTPQAPLNIQNTDGSGLGLRVSRAGAATVDIQTSADNGWIGTVSNDKLNFFTNNSGSLMAIDTTGHVGIGTTTPWGRLSVLAADNSSAPQFVIGSSTANSLLVDSTGRIGVGMLPASDDTVTVRSRNGGGISFYDETGSLQSQIQPAGLSASETGLYLNMPGTTGNIGDMSNWLTMRFNGPTNKILFGDTGTNAWIQSNHNLNLIAGTTYSTTTAPQVTLTTAGNLGIGTSTPWARLMIDNRGNDTNSFAIVTNGSAGNYTATNSAMFIRDAAGGEMLRIFASDPNVSDWNSANLYIGYQAGRDNPTDNSSAGYYNTGVGYQTLLSNTTGNQNTAFGYVALSNNTIGYNNSAFGNQAMLYSTSTRYDVAIGYRALMGSSTYSGTGSTLNTAVGADSMFNNAGGFNNAALGYAALWANATGRDNTALGYHSLVSNYDGSFNTAAGSLSLYSNTSGSYNSAFGRQSLYSNTTGYDNSAFGFESLLGNIGGYQNAAFGDRSLRQNTSGYANAAFGYEASRNNTTGTNNTAMGVGSLYSNTTGQENVAVGDYALYYNLSATNTVAIGGSAGQGTSAGYANQGGTYVGYQSGFKAASGSDYNTMLGYAAGWSNTTGLRNTFIGASAADNNTTGSENLAAGYFAAERNASATSTVALGAWAGYGSGGFYYNQGSTYLGAAAGYSAQSGSDYNTLLGYNSGYGVTTGARNVLIGPSTIAASYNQVTTGSNNIAIGNDVAVPSATANNQLVIGNLIYGTGLDGTGSTVSTGNVGIGTSTPWGKLSVLADNSSAPQFVAGSSTATSLFVSNAGWTTVGTTTAILTSGGLPYQWAMDANYDGIEGGIAITQAHNVPATASGQGAMNFFNNFGYYTGLYLRKQTSGGTGDYITAENSSGVTQFIVKSSGNVGIGTTTPAAQLSTTGTVRFAGLGSGGANLVTDALGNVTASSDERLKDKQGDFTRGLVAINAISPVLYKWRPETGFDTQSTYAGFFAQNVQTAIPEAVSPDSRGYLTLADRPILAALVNATKEIGTIAGAFKSSLIAWLGNGDNGIGDLFAKDIYATNGTFDTTTANTTNTHQLCITDGANDNAPLCLTKSQLAALLGQTGAAGAPTSLIPSAPVIELNGNASSTIEVGDTYNDLGAHIVAPASDINLGIVIVLDGATTTQVSIDTSTPGEHTISYTVTSPTTGLTGSIMRTVTVSPVAQSTTDFGMTALPQSSSPPPSNEPANDNPFNLSPSNDNAVPATTSPAIPTAA